MKRVGTRAPLAACVAVGVVALALLAPGAGSAAPKHGGGRPHKPSKPKKKPPKPQKRVYEMVFDGGLNESYKASDSTAFDLQRAGLVGCDFHQTGDLLLFWRSVWRINVTVQPGSRHVAVEKVTRTAGPANPQEPGNSEIDGANSDEGASTQCSEAELAGPYECTAEALTPIEHEEPSFLPDSDRAKTFLVKVPAFAYASASYAGKAPTNYGCAESAGTDVEPGGFIALDLAGSLGDAEFALPHEKLFRLKKKQKFDEVDVASNESKDWSFPIVGKGTSCALNAEESDEICSYEETNRGAELFIKRLK